MTAFNSKIEYLQHALDQIRQTTKFVGVETETQLNLIYDIANDALNEEPELVFEQKPIEELPIVRHVVEGDRVLLYRRYADIHGMSTGNWWYTPEDDVSWRPVHAPSIRKLLDEGKHPRDA